MKALNYIALSLVIVGAVNWGLIGFLDFNLVDALFGFRVIIVTVANSLGNIKVFELLPKLKTKKYGWCIA